MKFETLNSGKSRFWKRFCLGAFGFSLVLVGLLLFYRSYASYRVTANVQLVNGNVSYSLADFNLMAIYLEQKDGSGKGNGTYKLSPDGSVPSTGYKLKSLGTNTNDSYCMVGTTKNPSGLEISYQNGGVNVTGIKKQGTKCYFYFAVGSSGDPDSTLANLKITKIDGTLASSITGPSCKSDSNNCGGSGNNMKQNGVFETVDDYGKTYVFRGTLDNNWVKFGKFKSSTTNYSSDNGKDIWWRIIRINGNGTIRLIYAGAYNSGSTPNNNGTNLSIGNKEYNKQYGDNTYVGFTNTGGTTNNYTDAHKGSNDSDIKKVLDEWWTDTNLGEQAQIDHIDDGTGFCNDRELSEKAHSSYLGKGSNAGYGTQQTAYAPWDRLLQSGSTSAATDQKPSLKCTNLERDLYTGRNAKDITTSDGKTIKGNKKLTNPVGLITSDEVVFAGGYMYQNNTEYWLYTNQYYWTMSPFDFSSGYAQVFIVNTNGYLNNHASVNNANVGVRPVINLEADTTFTGGGTKGSPFVPS